jgi:hypothetical protein
MTSQVLFNPLTYIDRLTRGGFTPEQARASAEALESAFTESVVTKTDVAELKRDVSDVETRLRSEISETEGRLTLQMSESEARLKRDIAQSKHDILRWPFGFNLVLIGAIFAIVKFSH